MVLKTLGKIISLVISILMIFILTSINKINTYASSSLNAGNRKVANVAVVFYSLDDIRYMKLKQDFEDIQKENQDKVKFTFFDSKDNVAIQNQILDSINRNSTDLIVVFPVSMKESSVEDIINRAKQKDVPLILIGIDPSIFQMVFKYYEKVVNVGVDIAGSGREEGKIIAGLWNNNKNLMDKNGDGILQYVLLQGKVNSTIATERTESVISTINNLGIKTDQLAISNSNWSRELAKNAITSLFLKYNGKIEAIIANNNAMAMGAVEALQNYEYNKGDKNKQIGVFGIDGLPEAIDLIDKDSMTSTVITDTRPFTEGIYNIALNLINVLNLIENTNYKIINGEIIIPLVYRQYNK